MAKSHVNITLSNSDIQAIICALPLVTHAITDTQEQAMLNNRCCEAAASKLLSNKHTLTANEYRVIYLAVGTALDILEGMKTDYLFDFDLDTEWKAELSKNFFAYNRLYPELEKLINQFRK